MSKKNMFESRKVKKPLDEKKLDAFAAGALEGGESTEKAEKPAGKAGRPQIHSEGTKNKAFNLPLSLIEKIDRESKEVSGGNATAFAIKLFETYFAAKDEGRAGEAYGVEIRPKK